MADFGAPVAQNVNVDPNRTIQTLSGLLGLQQQREQLASQTAAAYQATQSATERQNLAAIPWKSFQNPDGSMDIDKATAAAQQAAPTTWPDFMSRFAQASEGGAETKKAWYGLNQTYQDGLRSIYGTWGGDPNANIVDLQKQIDVFKATAPKSAQAQIDQIQSHVAQILTGPDLISGQPKTAAQMKQGALAYSRAGLGQEQVSGAGGLATPVTGTTVGPSGQMVGTAQSRTTGAVAAAPGAVSLGLSPQQLATTITLPNGQVTTLGAFLGKSLGGGGGGAAPPAAAPSAPAPAAGPKAPIGRAGNQLLTATNDPNMPSPNAPKAAQDAWQANVAKATADVGAARDADSQYGNNMAVAEQVRRLSGEVNPGPGTPEMIKVIGGITSRFGGSQGVTDLQTLGSFLDRQAAGLRGAMGLPATNVGQEEARTIGGNIEMQKGAIQAKNNYNEALSQGLHEYRQGLDHVEGFSGNPSPSAVNAFKSHWANNFDPVAFEYKLAKQRGDTAAVNAIVRSLSPQQAQLMLSHLRATDDLAKGMVSQ